MIFKLAIATPQMRCLATPGLALFCLFGSACNGALYELPPPPPAQERQDVSLIPGEDDRARERDYLEARATVLKVYQYLSAKRYKEALSLLSEETVDFLSYVSPKKSSPEAAAEETLVQGKVVLSDGQVIPIDPAALLVARDISKLEDSLAGQKESETSRRKELFAIQADGKAQRIIVIKEAGQWVIHKTSISTQPLNKR